MLLSLKHTMKYIASYFKISSEIFQTIKNTSQVEELDAFIREVSSLMEFLLKS